MRVMFVDPEDPNDEAPDDDVDPYLTVTSSSSGAQLLQQADDQDPDNLPPNPGDDPGASSNSNFRQDGTSSSGDNHHPAQMSKNSSSSSLTSSSSGVTGRTESLHHKSASTLAVEDVTMPSMSTASLLTTSSDEVSRKRLQTAAERRRGIAIRLDRSPLTQDEFLSSYEYHEKESASVMEITRSAMKSGFSCSDFDWKSAVLNSVPLLRWLPHYSVKKDLLGDLIAGFTVAVMHIPQGMAYALLAGLPPVNGLYMAFFPVLIHLVFSTSRHNSVGTFAVVLMMTGTLSQGILEKYGGVPLQAADPATNNNKLLVVEPGSTTGAAAGVAVNANNGTIDVLVQATHIPEYVATQTVALVAFCVGMCQLLMGLMRIGALSVVLSDVLISGLTTGASMHILTSQIKGIFGIQVPRQYKFPKLLRTYVYLIDHLYESNVVAVVVSTVTMTALAVNNDFIKPRLAKRCRFPVPIELIAVVGGTLYSYFMQLNERYNLPILGTIPTGIPSPEPPPFEIIKDVLVGSLVIAVVAFTTSYSMAVIFAKRLNYEVDANQELVAHGLSNILGSFFQCGPSAASLSRSLIQQAVGGRTQIASGISAGLILVILLCLGPYFGPLPKCILSSIIIVSLKGLFVQFADFGKAWRSSKLDALIWIATFAGVVIIDIDYGLLIGVAISLVTLLWRNQRAYACVLGEIPNTGIYVDSQRFAAAKEIHNVKIFHYGAGLHFANRDYFREVLIHLTGLDPVKWHKQAIKRMKKERAEMGKAIKAHQKQDGQTGFGGSSSSARLHRSHSILSTSTTTTTMTRSSRPCPLLCCFLKNRAADDDNPRDDLSDEEADGPDGLGAPVVASPGSAAVGVGAGAIRDSSAAPSASNASLGTQKAKTKALAAAGGFRPPPPPVAHANSAEIKAIAIDFRSLSGGVTVGDSLALPASTGLRLRRRGSVHIDTTGLPLPFRYLLIDLSGISFVDMAGVKLLKSLVQDYDRINIQVLFAGTTEPVLHMFRKMSFYEDVAPQCFFPTVNDAVVCSRWKVVGGGGFRSKEKLMSVQEHAEEDEEEEES